MNDKAKRNKILVVDDEPINVKFITAVLENDYDVISAYSGKETLEKISLEKPDIVLLDIMMPEMSGYDVCEKIKQMSSTRFMPVVMVTALSGLTDKIKAIEVGADDYLIKPINRVELLARVQSLLKAKSFHDELIKSKEKIEEQSDFKTLMANILPILFQNLPIDKKTEIIRELSKQVEMILWEKYIHDIPDNTKQTADISCSILNRMGGSFLVENVNEKGYTVKNKKCPWEEYGNINSMLCMLTKAIFSRICIRVFKEFDVEVKKTIAGGDGHCLVEVSVGKNRRK